MHKPTDSFCPIKGLAVGFVIAYPLHALAACILVNDEERGVFGFPVR